MTADEFMQRFLDTTNGLRAVLGDELVTAERLKRAGCRVVPCGCSDRTCPGWVMQVPKG